MLPLGPIDLDPQIDRLNRHLTRWFDLPRWLRALIGLVCASYLLVVGVSGQFL